MKVRNLGTRKRGRKVKNKIKGTAELLKQSLDTKKYLRTVEEAQESAVHKCNFLLKCKFPSTRIIKLHIIKLH